VELSCWTYLWHEVLCGAKKVFLRASSLIFGRADHCRLVSHVAERDPLEPTDHLAYDLLLLSRFKNLDHLVVPHWLLIIGDRRSALRTRKGSVVVLVFELLYTRSA
jgi:hypothetical protein